LWAYNIFVSGLKFTIFCPMPKEQLLINRYIPIPDFSILFADIHGQSLKLSKIVPIFAHFSPSKIFAMLAPPKKYLYVRYHAHLAAHHAAKFCGATPTTPKVIGKHLLNFQPIFDPLYTNLLRGTTFPMGCASNT